MHGGDVYSNDIELDFSVNVNPLGAPAHVLTAAGEGAEKATQYPDPGYRALRREIGRRYGIASSRVVCGNGASELIMAVCRAFLTGVRGRKNGAERGFGAGSEGRPEAIILEPGFCGYRRALSSVNAEIRVVTLLEETDWVPDDRLEKMIEEVQPGLVLFSNPSNPTGVLLPESRMLSIARVCRDVGAILCADECFMELSDGSFHEDSSLIPACARSAAETQNLIILSAITKTFAVPGIRLGFAFCGSEMLAEALRGMLPEWNVSSAAQAAGIAAMQTDRTYLVKAGTMIRDERTYLSRELTACGFHVCPSRADYILFHGRPGLYDAMLQKKILIRDCSDYEGLGEGWYRIAVRQHTDNVILMREIRKWTGTETF